MMPAGAFHKRLRRRARAEITGSPLWQAAYGRALRARRWPRWGRMLLVALLIPAVPPAAFALVALIPWAIVSALHTALGTDGLFAVAAIFATFCSLGCAVAIQAFPNESRLVTVMSHLPMSDREIARRTFGSIVAWSATGLYLFIWIFEYVAWTAGAGPGGCALGFLLGVLQWLAGLSIAAVAVAFLPRFAWTGVLIVCIALAVGYALLRAPGWPILVEWSYRCVPAGRINAVFGLAWLRGVTVAWWGIPAAVLLTGGGIAAGRKLLNIYCIREFYVSAEGTVIPIPAEGSPAVSDWPSRFAPKSRIDGGEWRDKQSAEERARGGDFLLSRIDRELSLVNRVLRAFLTRRESVLFDFMTAESRVWEQWYKLLFGFPIGVVLLSYVPMGIPPQAVQWFGTIGCVGRAFFLCCRSLWFGFLGHEQGGIYLCPYSLLPIGFDEMTRLMIKVAAIRAILLLPVLVLSTIGPETKFDTTWALCVAGIAAGLCAWVVAEAFHAGAHFIETSRPPRLRWRNIPWRAAWCLSTLAGGFGSFVLLVIAAVLMPQAFPTWPAALFVGIDTLLVILWSSGLWFLARLVYRRGPIDLLRSRPSTGQQSLQQMAQVDQQHAQAQERRRRRKRLSPQMAGS